MHTCILNSLLLLYANDATLYLCHKNSDALVFLLNNDLRFLRHYCYHNKLIINFDKTKVLYFQAPNRTLDLQLHSNTISIVNSFKLLGVAIDKSMKFNSHCSFLLKKLNICIRILYRYRKLLPLHSLKLIFNCIGFPYITYCLYAYYDFVRVTDIRMIERKYVRCGRIMLDDNISSSQ